MRRAGYTLFEVVLVVSVLVVVGFVSLPMIKPMLSSNNMQAASDLVRARWTEMRNRAISDGRPYRFAIMHNTGKFRIAPEDTDFWGDSDNAGEGDQEIRPWVVEGTLPGSVIFVSADATSADGKPAAQSQSGGGWTRTVTFLPNGTAHEDVEVAFGQSGSRSVTLKLRGITGSVSSGEGKN